MTPEVTETTLNQEEQAHGQFELPTDPKEFDAFMENMRAGKVDFLDEQAVTKEILAEQIPAVQEEKFQEEPATPVEDAEKGKQFRLRSNDPRDQAVFAVMKANGLSYKEAESILFPNQTPAAIMPATEEKSQEPVETVESIDAEITKLRQERREAIKNLDFERQAELDDLLQYELPQKRAELADKQAKAAVSADQVAMQAYTQHQETAISLYPDAAVEGSPLYTAAAEIIDAWQANGDPILGKPESVLRAVQMAASELGIAPKRAGSPVSGTAKAPVSAPAPAPTRMRPAAGGTGQGAPPAEAASQLIQQMDSLDLDELRILARQFGR
jgi:hypothetical protein